MSGKYTFWKLINEYEIEIPVIQRDYAQGRNSASFIRSGLLESIRKALLDEEPMDMNFVYGSIENNRQFIPIDGQQRLTTLYLLHLYLAQATNKELKDFPQFQRFKYKTRISSEYFCKFLAENKIFDGRNNGTEDLREVIVDKHWFGSSWKQDPTVDSMLNMLKEIHVKFSGEDLDKFWEKLTDDDKCPIHFYFLNLGEYKLEDSIYIKMNARGKALTDYENFKAKLEKFLRDHEVSDWGLLATKLDTKWTEVFWQFIDSETLENPNGNVTFDDKVMNFITNYVYNDFACHTKITDRFKLRAKFDEMFTMTSLEFTNRFSSFDDELDGWKIADSFVNMFSAFALMTENTEIKKYAENNIYQDEDSIFKDIININISAGKNKFTPQTRTWFYAYTSFLLQNQEHINDADFEYKLTEWFRVIKHLIDGQYFIGLDEYVHVIHGINWLTQHSYDILSFLSKYDLNGNKGKDDEESNLNLPFFNQYVFEEECIKASLILKSESWNNAIRQAETNPYFQGDIFGALEFAGVTKETEPISEWDDAKSDEYLEKFNHYTSCIDELFNDYDGRIGLKREYENVFRRALLTKGNFTLKNKANMSFLVNKSNPRGDVTWRRLFKPQRGEEIITKRSYIKELLDDPNFDITQVEESCAKIISLYTCNDLNWKYFIEIPEVMDFVVEIGDRKNKSCFNFYRDDFETKFLLWSSQLNGGLYDYYKYALYSVLKREDSINVTYDKKNNPYEVKMTPIEITIAEGDVYKIDWNIPTQDYSISGGKNNVFASKETLEDMVKYVRENIIQ